MTPLSRRLLRPAFCFLLLPAFLVTRTAAAQSVPSFHVNAAQSLPTLHFNAAQSVPSLHVNNEGPERSGNSNHAVATTGLKADTPLSDLYFQRLMSAMQDTTSEPGDSEPQGGGQNGETTDGREETGAPPAALNGRQEGGVEADTSAAGMSYPDPNSVMLKSVMIPGWGQVVNRQAWKIPIIYGLFGGLGYALHELTKRYHDYRAAYYNLQRGDESDFRFGPTPSYIPENVGLQQLQDARNNARNQRDIMYIIMGVAYGLNVLDSYVYAHMRSFDVSDDLSANTTIGPSVVDGLAAGLRLQIQLKPH